MGNARSNKHWEAELPPNFDRNGYGIERFIRSKYVEKRWASKGELKPASKSAEIIFNRNESPAAGAKSAIQKSRRLSLEESIFVKHMNHVPPPTTRSPTPRSQELSPDLKNNLSPLPLRRPSASFDFDNSRMKNNGTADHFGLFSAPNAKQEFSTTPPSWITISPSTIKLTTAIRSFRLYRILSPSIFFFDAFRNSLSKFAVASISSVQRPSPLCAKLVSFSELDFQFSTAQFYCQQSSSSFSLRFFSDASAARIIPSAEPQAGISVPTSRPGRLRRRLISGTISVLFSYTPVHDVVEVNQLGYDTCTITNALATYDNGETVIHLGGAGTRYFVCGRMGHCQQGLKLQVQVLAQSNNGSNDDQNQGPGNTTSSPPPPSPPQPRSPPRPPSPPPHGVEHSPADEPSPCDCSGADERFGVVPLITLVIVLAFARAPSSLFHASVFISCV
ncbi:hypothetical protein V8G54_011272 [Vigna mungo]|uniref:Phytocyanin domain-containing protein n=1 Tax=Vigna mungo TaxID=3915 RepID=A0AAQ3NPC9_VIGMU